MARPRHRVLPELSSDLELGARATEVLQRHAGAVRALVEHHQTLGNLVIEPVEDTIRAFLGPLLARAALRSVLPVEPFDAEGYVQRFPDDRRG